jgi:PAS domain S-box-containing protein
MKARSIDDWGDASDGVGAVLPEGLAEAESFLLALAEVFLPGAAGGRAETAALRDREQPGVEDRYRALVEQIPAVVFMAYMDRGIGEAYVSPQIEAILGFTQEEWLNDPVRWYRQIHPDDKGRWSLEAAQMVLTGQPLRSVYRVLARDGRVVWFHCEAKMVRAADGRPWFIHGVGFDVSELKRAEEALRESEAMLRELFDSAPDTVVVVDGDGRIARANAQIQRMLGFTRDELVGRPVEVLLPERLRRSHAWHREDYIAEPRIRPMGAGLELFCRCKDGTELPVDIMLSPVGPAAGGQVIAVVRDITARKGAEEALKRREEELSALSASLLSVQDEERRRIARELHDSTAQNLAGLAMNLSLLAKAAVSVPDPAVHRILTDSRALAEQCSREVRNLSYLLHPPLLDDLGLAPALKSYIAGFSHRTGIEVQLDVPPDLGRLAPEVETALFRIVQEGLTNVHRHSGSTRAAIRLTLTDGEVRLAVEDEGTGAVPRASEDGVRLGVGVPGMRERAQQLGGHMEIESGRDGTTVIVSLPRRSGK